MNPEADDHYECLSLDPTVAQSELEERITEFLLEHGDDYPNKMSEIDKIRDVESRRKYNRNNGYPTDLDQPDGVVTLRVGGPDVVEKGEPVTITVTDGDGSPEPDASVTLSGTDRGTTDSNGRCSFVPEDMGSWTITASKSTSDGVHYRDGEHDIEITSERRELSATVDPATITVGEPVTVTVTDGDGGVEDAVVEFPGGLEPTDSSGEITATINSADEYDIAIEKADEPEVTYDPTSVTLTVEPKHVVLDITPDATSAIVGNSLGVTVTDKTDEGVEGVTVSAGSCSDTTDIDGRAWPELAETGTVPVEASKADDPDRTFTDAETTISVDRRQRDLSVKTDDLVEVGEPLSVTVTDDRGDAVENSEVEVPERGLSEDTDGEGTCRFTFSKPDTVEVIASKEPTSTTEYTSSSTYVSVERASRRLQVSPTDTTVEGGTPVEFQVTDDAGNEVSEATVETPSGPYQTEDDGTCEVVFETLGTADIKVERSDTDAVSYAGTEGSVKVERRRVSLSVTTGSDTVEFGDAVTVVVRDDSGDSVTDAVVSCGSERKQTDDRGRCVVYASTEPSIDVRAEKDDEPTVTYESDTKTVEVVLEQRILEMEVPDTATAGGSATVEVRDGTGPVEGAVVTSPTDEVATDGSGEANVPLPSSTVANLSVRKPITDGVKYHPGTARIELDDAGQDQDPVDEEPDGLGRVALSLAVLSMVSIPLFIGLFVFLPGLNTGMVLFGVLVVVLMALFGLIAGDT